MTNQDLLSAISEKLAFQNRWRRVMSGAYFTVTAMALICSATATVASGLGHAGWGSIFAGTATALLGIEKTLLLREKWSHHLAVSAQLEALEAEVRFGGLTTEQAATRLGSILVDYAGKLPIAPPGTKTA